MDYVKKIFQRMNLQQICAFLLNGTEKFDIETQSYKEKLKTAS